jgi:tRNA pseudouridine55 synthase
MIVEENNLYRQGQVLLFNKPYGWSSFRLVKKVRYLLRKHQNTGKIKIGHAGTLDPLATGLMILCTGKATKQISRFQDLEKEYIAELELGKTTPSFDKETPVDFEYECAQITEELFIGTLKDFTGEIRQVPPLFSAKNVQGERAYKLARKGVKVELTPVPIFIRKIELLEFKNPIAKIRVVCGKGTYIRALVRDIGTSLNSGAYLVGLVRTRIGDFTLENAREIDEFEEMIEKV